MVDLSGCSLCLELPRVLPRHRISLETWRKRATVNPDSVKVSPVFERPHRLIGPSPSPRVICAFETLTSKGCRVSASFGDAANRKFDGPCR